MVKNVECITGETGRQKPENEHTRAGRQPALRAQSCMQQVTARQASCSQEEMKFSRWRGCRIAEFLHL